MYTDLATKVAIGSGHLQLRVLWGTEKLAYSNLHKFCNNRRKLPAAMWEMRSINFLNKDFSKAPFLSCLSHIHQQTPLQVRSSVEQLVFSPSRLSFKTVQHEVLLSKLIQVWNRMLKSFHSVAMLILYEVLRGLSLKCCHQLEGKAKIISLSLVKSAPL